jgi:hypothetical protein
MTVRRLSTVLAGVVITTVITHVVWSYGVALVLERTYRHRIMDLRRWSGRDQSASAQRELLARFLDLEVRRANRPTVVFLGSSFSFGYPWQERVILSRRYSELRPDQTVLNASVTGGGLPLVHNWAICAARRQQLLLDAAVIEIPVINTVASLLREFEGQGGITPLESCSEPPVSGRGYLPFVLKQPLGLGWVRFVWDVEAYEKPDEPIVVIPVPAGYFVSRENFSRIKGAYQSQIIATLTQAKTVAKRVYAFPSPVYLPALDEIEEDAGAIQEQLSATLDSCRAVPGVECLDPDAFYRMKEAYYNITHLNQHGHDAMARWLAEKVSR